MVMVWIFLKVYSPVKSFKGKQQKNKNVYKLTLIKKEIKKKIEKRPLRQ